MFVRSNENDWFRFRYTQGENHLRIDVISFISQDPTSARFDYSAIWPWAKWVNVLFVQGILVKAVMLEYAQNRIDKTWAIDNDVRKFNEFNIVKIYVHVDIFLIFKKKYIICWISFKH